jgi:hypothetical protein
VQLAGEADRVRTEGWTEASSNSNADGCVTVDDSGASDPATGRQKAAVSAFGALPIGPLWRPTGHGWSPFLVTVFLSRADFSCPALASQLSR